MKFERFEQRARQIFAEIPVELRHGVETVQVSRDTVAHPALPDVYTLGECSTGELDLGLEAESAQRSAVFLYHGSFRQLAQQEAGFDWEDELRETILHEVRHHRESLAGEDALDDLDWAEDENFKRRAGKPFDPQFFRAGIRLGDDSWEVDGDRFVLRELTRRERARGRVQVEVAGERLTLPVPRDLGDAHYVCLRGRGYRDAELAVVLVPRRGFWAQVAQLIAANPPRVSESTPDLGPPNRVSAPSAGPG